MKHPAFLFFCALVSYCGHAQVSVVDTDATPLRRAEKAITAIMVHDIFSPPVASRIYLYTSVAAYEVLAKGHAGEYRSLYGQAPGMPMIPAPREKINYSLAAVYAYMLTGRSLVFSEPMADDSMHAILRWYEGKNISQPVREASMTYGRQAADSIMAWADKDHYKQTRSMSRYRLSKGDGKWLPTPPAYMAAVEPYWNKMRLITLDSASQFRPAPAPAFSKDTSSIFYQQAYDVYTAGKKMTAEQRAIAAYWDCNPFAVTMEGHLQFAVKKISPGGHWMRITGAVAAQKGVSLMETAAAYTITSIAIFDAFISCWDEKYRSNVIRPETYVDANIDETWRPLLQTPPFPEYTSGHSIISTVSATVLSAYFGEHCVFTDNTEVEFGLPPRHFDSFVQASQEAAISRFYGGIHYRAAIEAGVVSGKQIGDWVLGKIKLKQL